ncbi:MAG TPA: phosphotransferase [Blastocatellia bacterium]|nr:phosphotransferase [Blastocatellia bacterium]
MNNSAHAKYRSRLAALALDDCILRAIADAARRPAWWSAGRRWTRTHERFSPGQEPFATLVFESSEEIQAICHVDVFSSRPNEQDADDVLTFDEGAGWLHLKRFPADRHLNTLAAVLRTPGRPTVMRYRPGRRCTIRFDRNERTRFAKVYPKKFWRYERGENFIATGQALWQAARSGRLGFSVAKPIGWDSELRTLWQERLEGAPALIQLFRPEGLPLARRLGEAAATLTLCEVKPHKTFDWMAQVSSSMRSGKELADQIPRLADSVSELLEALAEIHSRIGVKPLRPIHGDLDASQWLDEGGRLGLADFDDFALGDPELDVATLLVELEFEDELQLQVAELSEAFRIGYESIAGPLNEGLLIAYTAHKRLSKALRAARALRPDGDKRAEQILNRAARSFSEMSAAYCGRGLLERAS